MQDDSDSEIAYVVEEFPCPAELSIGHEIHRLESMGLSLRIYSITLGEDSKVNGVFSLIRAPVIDLPPDTRGSSGSLVSWLYHNLRAFLGSQLRLMVRRPWPYFRTLAQVIAMSWKYRDGTLTGPMRVFVTEFLRAGKIAVEVLDVGTVRHLHGHCCRGTATVTWLTSLLTGLPFSFTVHSKEICASELNPGDLLRRTMLAARFVVACTAANHRQLSEICPQYQSLQTVYHGLDVDYFAPRPLPHENRAPVILSVGRFVEKKGFEYLIAACAQLKAAGVSFSCWLVGPEGSHSERIHQTIETLDVSDVVSTNGAVTQAQLRELYRRTSVFVLPRLQLDNGDGIPNVLAEAMAMGIPVVTTDISGIGELIENGQNGILVPQRDSQSLARVVQSLLGSAELRRRLGQAGRQTICRNFDSSHTTSHLRDLFLTTIQNPASQPEAMPDAAAP